jgi:hypothetical protein
MSLKTKFLSGVQRGVGMVIWERVKEWHPELSERELSARVGNWVTFSDINRGINHGQLSLGSLIVVLKLCGRGWCDLPRLPNDLTCMTHGLSALLPGLTPIEGRVLVVLNCFPQFQELRDRLRAPDGDPSLLTECRNLLSAVGNYYHDLPHPTRRVAEDAKWYREILAKWQTRWEEVEKNLNADLEEFVRQQPPSRPGT